MLAITSHHRIAYRFLFLSQNPLSIALCQVSAWPDDNQYRQDIGKKNDNYILIRRRLRKPSNKLLINTRFTRVSCFLANASICS